MKNVIMFVAVLTLAVPMAASGETWKGTITDSMCGLKHSADKHEGKTADHRACVQKCIKEGGEYVFVAGDKLHKISNQKFAGLKVHAGHEVMLTGAMKDDVITVSKIAMPKAAAAKK
ncbi:MAG: hypothetical protein H0U19_04590 [Acidobacteria bacterium]|nr:hypothetical protein [Acidobacteriota bacterium]